MNKARSLVILAVLGLFQLIGVLFALGSLTTSPLTNPFHYLSDPVLLRLESPEMILLIGVITYLLSSVFLVAATEVILTSQSLCNRFALLGLLPVVGVISPFFVRQKACDPLDATQNAKGQTLAAVTVMGLAALMMIFGTAFINETRNPFDSKIAIAPDEANQSAYLAIKNIMQAQAEYKKQDWDGDGKNEFALFVVHLWRTARKRKAPVDVNLIDKNLAVARVPDFAYHGFTFRNLHHQALAKKDPNNTSLDPGVALRELDYSKEWALFAEPSMVSREDESTYPLQLISLSDGRVFARKYKGEDAFSIPFDLEKEWVPISSIEDIKRLQSKSTK